MIKINLNKTKSSVYLEETYNTGLAKPGETVFTKIFTNIAGTDFSQSLEPGILIKFFAKILLILSCPFLLKVQEVNNINKLKVQKKEQEQFLDSSRQKFNKLVAEIKTLSHMQDKAKEYNQKKQTLSLLAESRLIIPQTIDLIQSKIPKTVWLERLKIDLVKDEKIVHITGKSFNESQVNLFAISLREVLDENSIIVDTKDIKEGSSVIKVKFNLKGKL